MLCEGFFGKSKIIILCNHCKNPILEPLRMHQTKWFNLVDAILETPYLQMYLWLFYIMSHIMGQLHPVMVTILMGWPDLKLHKRLCLPVTSIKADAQGQENSPPHCTAILGVKHYFPVILTHASSLCFNLRFRSKQLFLTHRQMLIPILRHSGVCCWICQRLRKFLRL